jgi:hypothetical protein
MRTLFSMARAHATMRLDEEHLCPRAGAPPPRSGAPGLLPSHHPQALASDDFGATRVEGLVLYRSDPGSGGAIYTPLATLALGG